MSSPALGHDRMAFLDERLAVHYEHARHVDAPLAIHHERRACRESMIQWRE